METLLKSMYEKNSKLPVLPKDIINYIKTYTGEVKIRNGVFTTQIPKDDERYFMLKKKPIIKYHKVSAINKNIKGTVWFKINDKYMVISVYNNKKVFGNNNKDVFLHEYFYNDNCIITNIV
jgi:hypothetical protein